MNLKELKKLADALDESGKRELIYFLQSRTKLFAATPIRAIDDIQEQKHKGNGCKLGFLYREEPYQNGNSDPICNLDINFVLEEVWENSED